MQEQQITSKSPYRPAVAMFAVGWGANMFAPMLLVYAKVLSGTAIAVVFAAYWLGLFPSLLFGARLSDRWGRRNLMRAVILVSIVGSGVLLFAGSSFGLLALGRVIVGLAAGAAFGPGTVWLSELNDRSGSRRSAPILTAVALTSGFALGPLVSGGLAQWLILPAALPYLVHIGLMLCVAPIVWSAPETAPRTSAKNRPTIGAALRNPLFLRLVLPTAPWVFGSIAAAIVVLPQTADLGEAGIAATGAVAALTLLSGVLVQPVASRLALRQGLGTAFVGGLVLLCLGMIAGAGMEFTRYTPLLFPAAVLLGCAYGFLLTAGLRAIPLIARIEDRSLLTGIFYVLAYSGFFWPILVNVLAPAIPKTAMFALSAAVGLATVIPVRKQRIG
ncbi:MULTISPECIES: MFS transporter [Pseudomonadota]|jgi:MFS family permease|uniref:MFS transporter n=1 Tax=Pseudomonadota TaxID=1224 RepID=UPI001907A262|nr:MULTISPECIES: MFS transporter [Pseudomonadota]MCG8277222.1 MFS transporter [Stenotrophomonas sp. NLF4-10]MDT8246790.1 MFS transporter [Pseudomonas aeruginosa]GBC57205.1 probable MFS-transporter [Stutzerimonas stutzeri]HBN9701858.1 MFS transporter [Pseudomonas aeruginosa]HBN9720801.1 MFS transporter [Pseudomonas aeruginosa]